MTGNSVFDCKQNNFIQCFVFIPINIFICLLLYSIIFFSIQKQIKFTKQIICLLQKIMFFENLQQFIESEVSNIKNIQIDLQYKWIQSQGVLQLSQKLHQCLQIIQLQINLQFNQIGKEGLDEIAKAIVGCKLLNQFSINLESNQIKSEDIQNFSQCLPLCYNLKNLCLDLICNEINNEGALELSTSISQCKNLKSYTLELFCNKIDFEGYFSMCKVLQSCNQIYSIRLLLNQKDKKLTQIVKKSKRLVKQIQN
ncbi:transmembrane protein, putative (macronuclear) [Tetrahymena thermophila SB210]|uniref:Transmembrane protein, putative n=1 Tax=Tetrahymena thermophila (strain SB210) TaxID=312017 RepID=W7XKM7_TETTS|nr:transmembrane protein, putative [Tetrahymena thermophila SB210]EWS75044.1 transmembrane protein, putative [Tetrahymena thermophila SB210]|eukprot:XP_012652419.1 transmembrane protein, putative [Tetrahymena thermophila SB210]